MQGTNRSNRGVGLVWVGAAVLLWGVIPFLLTRVKQEMSASEVTLLRFILSGLILGSVLGFKEVVRAVRQNWWLFFLLSFVGFSFSQLVFMYALTILPETLANFIASSYPVLSVGLAVLVLKERPTWVHGVAIAGALAGLYLLTGANLTAGEKGAVGVMWALLSAAGWAISGVVGKRMTANLPPMTIVAGRTLLGGILVSPMIFFEPHRAYEASLATWGWMAVLTAITIASYTFYYRGLSKTTVSNAALLESFQPVVALGAGVILGRPWMTGTQLAGAGLVLIGALMVSAQELLIKRKEEVEPVEAAAR